MKNCISFILLLLLLSGCMQKIIEPVEFIAPQRAISYLAEVKPILDKRCVVCHSCYNSPCQLKLSSYEGLDRGASKEAIYNGSRLATMEPSRLFIDAVRTEEWRGRGFFSVTESSMAGDKNDSTMLHLLSHKMKNPQSIGDFYPEADDLQCAKNNTELSSYLQKHPNQGMPFGFPPLKKEEFETIAGWLVQGAHGASDLEQQELERIKPVDGKFVDMWELFLNKQDAKHVMTARYLYEHLFLAHIRFNTSTNDFFELVRSRTPPGEPIEIIATVRPYDDPKGSFFYRFKKIHSTIVHKTHMVFTFDQAAYERVKELFIEPEWLEEPRIVGYEGQDNSNPFVVFQQIPPRSRYQFLLDNAHYIIKTFIRGPVCKGQVALNVINDHFWIFFMDPEKDLSVMHPAFLRLHKNHLRMPANDGSSSGLLKALNNPYHELALSFYRAKQQFYAAHHYNGQSYDAIWRGGKEDDSPVLTVFRHFDSASVHRGVLGDLPRTLWVIDYPLFERIYYSLVAGFDVYGAAGHQLTTRLYMDYLRREAEGNFLDFLPYDMRASQMKEWYHGMKFIKVHYLPTEMDVAINYETDDPKREFAEHIITRHLNKNLGISFDPVNYVRGDVYPPIPEKLENIEDILQALHAVSVPGVPFFSKITSNNANLAYLRVEMDNGEDYAISIVVNRWHDNVTFLFGERNTLDSSKDSADFFQGFIGSYPNYFFHVKLADMHDFVQLMLNYSGTDEQKEKLKKYGVNRNDDDFWEIYDWFQEKFNNSDPVESGLFDLNRYYFRGI